MVSHTDEKYRLKAFENRVQRKISGRKTDEVTRQWRRLHNQQLITNYYSDEQQELYRVIHKSLRNFRTRLRNNQDRHGRKEHINR